MRSPSRIENAGVSLVVGIESRGFILGAAVADRIGAGFVPVRKVGKLPSKTVKVSYDLEYGSDSLEMHNDAIEQGQRVLIVDDLLATGGTARATVDLVKQLGGEVAASRASSSWSNSAAARKVCRRGLFAVLQY